MTDFTFEERIDAKRDFFDFYAMIDLYLRCGGFRDIGYNSYLTFVNENIYNRIAYTYEEVVDNFYKKVYGALLESVKSELRHFPCHLNTYWMTEANAYNKLSKEFDITKPMIILAKKNPGKHLRIAYHIFNVPRWNCSYGGEKWANAVQVLIDAERIKTRQDKVHWIDRVMDLYHNTGHLLNKTEFCVLSERDSFIRKTCANKEIKIYVSALTFRAKSRSVLEFIPYTSYKVKKLLIPRAKLLGVDKKLDNKINT